MMINLIDAIKDLTKAIKNKNEEGSDNSGSGVFTVSVQPIVNAVALDKTFSEIKDAFDAGMNVRLIVTMNNITAIGFLMSISNEGLLALSFLVPPQIESHGFIMFIADSIDEYPYTVTG